MDNLTVDNNSNFNNNTQMCGLNLWIYWSSMVSTCFRMTYRTKPGDPTLRWWLGMDPWSMAFPAILTRCWRSPLVEWVVKREAPRWRLQYHHVELQFCPENCDNLLRACEWCKWMGHMPALKIFRWWQVAKLATRKIRWNPPVARGHDDRHHHPDWTWLKKWPAPRRCALLNFGAPRVQWLEDWNQVIGSYWKYVCWSCFNYRIITWL